MIEVNLLPEPAWDRWDQFVAESAKGSLFQTAWWHQAWNIEPKVLASLDQKDAITAGIACHFGRQYGFHAMRRPPMTPTNAPIIRPLANADAGHKHLSHMREHVLALLAAMPKAALLDLALHADLLEPAQFHWLGFDAMIGITYVIGHDRLAWRKSMSSQRRRQLDKARRELEERGARLELDPPIEEVAVLLQDTAEVKNYRRSHRGHHDRLGLWWQAVTLRQAGRLYGLRDNHGDLLCATILVWDRRKAYYLGGGVRKEIRQRSHLNVLLFERMIDDAQAQGLDFDFEGSVLPGVERFFRAFGGTLQPTYRFIKIASPMAFVLWQAHRFWSRHRLRLVP